MSWLVTAYFTGHPIYKEHAAKLAQSMLAHKIRYEIVNVPDLGTWQANTQFKPAFLMNQLQRYPSDNIVYVDVDAVFLRYPALFDDLDKNPSVNVAVHLLDHSKYRRKTAEPEILSGTVWLRNNHETMTIVAEWINQCKANINMWDQAALQRVLQNRGYYNLPDRYCCIFDYMASVQGKVIVHNQASRVTKTFTARSPVTVQNSHSISIGRHLH